MRAVVSFANTKFYQDKMKRLQDSVESQGVKFIGYKSFEEIGCRPHSEIPYQFKPYAIQKAIDDGVTTLLWCDSPIIAIKDISPVFEHIEKHGYLFFANHGHNLGKWTDEKCLKHFGISREEAMSVTQIMACAQGINVENKEAISYFREYLECSKIGLYNGGWDSFRHDQTCASHIIYRNGLTILNGHETYFIYEHFKQVFTIAPTVCLVSR